MARETPMMMRRVAKRLDAAGDRNRENQRARRR